MSVINKDLGVVTAYAYAVEAGYTGTEEEFEQALGDLAELVTDFENFTVEVTTLAPGSSATASYADGVLSLGIPEGKKGDTGATPNLTIGTVATLAPGSDATATITGTAEAPVLSLGIPEGDPGEVPAAALASDFSASVSYKKGDYVWKSGTLYEFTADHAAGAWTGSDATAAKVADDVADLKSAFSKCIGTDIGSNLSFSKGYYNANGSITESSTSAWRYALADVHEYNATVLYMFGGTVANNTVSICFFTSGMTLISSDHMYNADHEYVIPNETYYIGLSYNVNNNVLFMLNDGVYGDVEKLESDVEENKFDLDMIADNAQSYTAFTGEIVKTDGYYKNAAGQDVGLYSNWSYYTFHKGEGIEINFKITSVAGQAAPLWIAFDSDGNVTGYSSDASTIAPKTEEFVASKKVTTIIVNFKSGETGYSAPAILSKKKEFKSDVFDIPNEENLDVLYGKTLVCVGDSITYGSDMDAEGITDASNITVYNCNSSGDFSQTLSHFLKTWGWQIASRNNMTFYNGGVSGSTMQGLSDRSGFSLENGRYTKLPDNIDYLLIWFGWNDEAYGTLGSIDDTTNASYYGGYNVVLPYLINKYPYAKIGLMVPFGSSAGHREAVRLLGNKWGCAVWDNYQGGTPLYYGKEDSVGVSPTIVTSNRAKFQANGAHPNFKGHRQLADMIEEWLKGI